MSRSRRKRNKKKITKQGFLIFFIIGIAIGILSLVLYKIYAPKPYRIPKRPTIVYLEKKLPPPAHFKIAVVLDDFGYNYKSVEQVIALKRPITFSVLPNLPYSKTISRRVHQKGLEAILHLPLEPRKEERAVKPEADTITVDMEKDKVLDRLNKAIESTPYVIGVSSHQGSKATEDAALMKTIFVELKKRDLFFLDSLVSNRSVCKKIAKEVGIRFGRRDIFLDNKEDFEYIRGQMRQLIRRAKTKGAAVGIGHDREKTVAALSQLMPEAQKEGAEFVFLSELVK